jgi:hypothetical protein
MRERKKKINLISVSIRIYRIRGLARLKDWRIWRMGRIQKENIG